MTLPHIPPPTPVMIHLLANLDSIKPYVGDRVSVVLDTQLPALRVASIGYAGKAATDWEACPMFQIEVWAEDFIEAEEIAWVLANTWTSATRQIIGSAAVHGRWVVQNPIHAPARMTAESATGASSDEETYLARFLITVGFRLTGVTS
jgi:hypothetical protein